MTDFQGVSASVWTEFQDRPYNFRPLPLSFYRGTTNTGRFKHTQLRRESYKIIYEVRCDLTDRVLGWEYGYITVTKPQDPRYPSKNWNGKPEVLECGLNDNAFGKNFWFVRCWEKTFDDNFKRAMDSYEALQPKKKRLRLETNEFEKAFDEILSEE